MPSNKDYRPPVNTDDPAYKATFVPPFQFDPFSEVPNLSSTNLVQWLESTQIIPISAKEWACELQWKINPRVVDDNLWFHVIEGEGSGWVGSNKELFKLAPGDLVLIPKGVEHSIFPKKNVAMRVHVVHFHAYVYGCLYLLELLGVPYFIKHHPHSPFATISHNLSREYARQSPGWQKGMEVELFRMLLYLIRQFGEQFNPVSIHSRNFKILPVMQFIEQELGNADLSIQQLSQTIYVSEVHLRKLFKQIIGLSPINFLQKRRIENACILLRTSHLEIKEIADQSGYPDLTFFYRVFKKWTNTTPAKYRNQEFI